MYNTRGIAYRPSRISLREAKQLEKFKFEDYYNQKYLDKLVYTVLNNIAMDFDGAESEKEGLEAGIADVTDPGYWVDNASPYAALPEKIQIVIDKLTVAKFRKLCELYGVDVPEIEDEDEDDEDD